MPITLTPSGGTASKLRGGIAFPSFPIVPVRPGFDPNDLQVIALNADKSTINPRQILGYIPLNNCNESECRDFPNDCYINPVFGSNGYTGDQSGYDNDITPFYIEDKMKRPYIWTLEKAVNGTWQFSKNLSALGKTLDYGTWTAHPYYYGKIVNWGEILMAKGQGIYRVKLIPKRENCQTINIGDGWFKINEINPADGVVKITVLADGVAIAPEFTCTGTNTITNMQAMEIWINNYQYATYPEPEYLAAYASNKLFLGSITGTNPVISYHIVTSGTNYSIFTCNGFSGGYAIEKDCVDFCMVSEPFYLQEFDCNKADRTVKFESLITGKIGDIVKGDGSLFDLSGNTNGLDISLYDCVRLKGIFGFEKTTYDEVMLEYQTGLIDSVRDEALQTFKYESNMMPYYIHERFKGYGLMADTLLVSDYNKNNSNYNIKRKEINKSGAYEPKYYQKNRLMSVTVEFMAAIQNVIKTNSDNVN